MWKELIYTTVSDAFTKCGGTQRTHASQKGLDPNKYLCTLKICIFTFPLVFYVLSVLGFTSKYTEAEKGSPR